eukprot:scpid55076/ scgid12344/ 
MVLLLALVPARNGTAGVGSDIPLDFQPIKLPVCLLAESRAFVFFPLKDDFPCRVLMARLVQPKLNLYRAPNRQSYHLFCTSTVGLVGRHEPLGRDHAPASDFRTAPPEGRKTKRKHRKFVEPTA